MSTTILNFCGLYIAFMKMKNKTGGWLIKSNNRDDLLNKCISIYFLNRNL